MSRGSGMLLNESDSHTMTQCVPQGSHIGPPWHRIISMKKDILLDSINKWALILPWYGCLFTANDATHLLTQEPANEMPFVDKRWMWTILSLSDYTWVHYAGTCKLMWFFSECYVILGMMTIMFFAWNEILQNCAIFELCWISELFHFVLDNIIPNIMK